MEEKNPNEPVVSDEELKMPEEQFGSTNENNKEPSSLGVILGALIIVLILLIAGLYLWSTTMVKDEAFAPSFADRPTAEENNEPESNNAEADVETMGALSTSDEIEAIEADLESTKLENLDAEMTAIEAELDASSETQ